VDIIGVSHQESKKGEEEGWTEKHYKVRRGEKERNRSTSKEEKALTVLNQWGSMMFREESGRREGIQKPKLFSATVVLGTSSLREREGDPRVNNNLSADRRVAPRNMIARLSRKIGRAAISGC